jgi:hypothetical protein
VENETHITQVTDMQGVLPTARQCIRQLIESRTGSSDITFDVYREWSGGWRIAAQVSGPVSGSMDFILFHTPQGGILAMPAQLPARWRAQGIAASDGSLWTMDEQGKIRPV